MTMMEVLLIQFSLLAKNEGVKLYYTGKFSGRGSSKLLAVLVKCLT